MKIRSVVLLCLLLLPIKLFAHSNVVVVPLGGDDLLPLDNVISVSARNGDFTSLGAALNSIKDSALDNPYLVVVGPGVYAETELASPAHVTIVGSGKQATRLEVDLDSISGTPFNFPAGPVVVKNLTINFEGAQAFNEPLIETHINDDPLPYLDTIKFENVEINVLTGQVVDTIFTAAKNFELNSVNINLSYLVSVLRHTEGSRIMMRGVNIDTLGPVLGSAGLISGTSARTFEFYDGDISAPVSSVQNAGPLIQQSNIIFMRIKNSEFITNDDAISMLDDARSRMFLEGLNIFGTIQRTDTDTTILDSYLSRGIGGVDTRLRCHNVVNDRTYANTCFPFSEETL